MAEARDGVGRVVWVSVTIAAAYYLGARLGFLFTLQPTPVSTLWPPNALLLAGLLLTPTRLWPGVLVATLGAHLAVQGQAGVPVPMMLCWYVSNCTEALLGASLLRRAGGHPPAFDRFRYAALFVLLRGGRRAVALDVSRRRVRPVERLRIGAVLDRVADALLLERPGHPHARAGRRRGEPEHRRDSTGDRASAGSRRASDSAC